MAIITIITVVHKTYTKIQHHVIYLDIYYAKINLYNDCIIID